MYLLTPGSRTPPHLPVVFFPTWMKKIPSNLWFNFLKEIFDLSEDYISSSDSLAQPQSLKKKKNIFRFINYKIRKKIFFTNFTFFF